MFLCRIILMQRKKVDGKGKTFIYNQRKTNKKIYRGNLQRKKVDRKRESIVYNLRKVSKKTNKSIIRKGKRKREEYTNEYL